MTRNRRHRNNQSRTAQPQIRQEPYEVEDAEPTRLRPQLEEQVDNTHWAGNPALNREQRRQLDRAREQTRKEMAKTVILRYGDFEIEATKEELDDFYAVNALNQNNPGPLLEILFPEQQDRTDFLNAIQPMGTRLTRVDVIGAIYEMLASGGLGN